MKVGVEIRDYKIIPDKFSYSLQPRVNILGMVYYTNDENTVTKAQTKFDFTMGRNGKPSLKFSFSKVASDISQEEYKEISKLIKEACVEDITRHIKFIYTQIFQKEWNHETI